MSIPFDQDINLKGYNRFLLGECGSKIWDDAGNLTIEVPEGNLDIISSTDVMYLNSKRLLTTADQGATRFGFPSYTSGVTNLVGTVYQAATDGWLSLIVSGSYMNDIYVYVGSTNIPTTLVWRSGDDINGNTKYAATIIPIPAGTYYKVANGTNPFETVTYKWYPSESATAVAAAGRELLTGIRTYYVRTDGSDTNSGLADSALGAFLTIQKAVDIVCDKLDMAGYGVIIQVRNGTFTGNIVLRNYVGRVAPVIIGNTTTPSSCLLSTASHAVNAAHSGPWYIKGFKITTTANGVGIVASRGSLVYLSNIDFGVCSAQHMFASQGTIVIETNYAISGGCIHHMASEQGGVISNGGAGRVVTITNTPNLGVFALAQTRGNILFGGNTYSGSATGVRYSATTGSFIQAGTATPPGNSAGTVDASSYFMA